MGTSPAGWYPDPEPGATGVRYWDGSQWTAQTAPIAPPQWIPARQDGLRPATAWIAAVGGAVLLVLMMVGLAATMRSDRGDRAPDIFGSPSANAYRPKLEPDGDPKAATYPFAHPATGLRTLVPAALFVVPSGPDVVTPASARAVVTALWDKRRVAIDQGTLTELTWYENGSALAVDGHRDCGCPVNDYFGAATVINVAVPHAHAFPASFFAEVSTTLNGRDWRSVLVLTRARASDPWRLTFAGGGQPVNAGDSMFPFALDARGFAVTPPASTATDPRPTAALAEYWQRVKDAGDPSLPVTLAPGGLTDSWGEQLVNNLQAKKNAANGYVTYYRFEVDPATTNYVVALANGTELECGSIIEQETYTAGRGRHFVQQQSRANWGAEVAPGDYAAMLEVSEYTPCFQYKPGIAHFVANGVTPPDQVALIGIK